MTVTFSDVVVDQYGAPVVGAQITVLDSVGSPATLVGVVGNVVATDATGAFSFTAAGGLYTLQYRLSSSGPIFRTRATVLQESDVLPGAEAARDLSRLYAISDTDAPISGAVSTSDRGAKYYSGVSATQAGVSTAQAGIATAAVNSGIAYAYFATKAAGDAGVGALSAGQMVLVDVDESQGNQRSAYRVESGALAYKYAILNLTNSSAAVSVKTLAVTRGSAGPTATFVNTGYQANVTEYAQYSGTVKASFGSFSTEAGWSYNFKYYTGVHDYHNDSTKYQFWNVMNNGGWFIQKSPPGYSTDTWINSGSAYLASIDNLGTGGADVWIAKFTGDLWWGAGPTLAGNKNYLVPGGMRLTDTSGVQAIDIMSTLTKATVKTNYYSGSDRRMVLGCASTTGDQMTLWPGGEVDILYGLLVGSPTGGYKGTGTINAQAVYDDNTLLTDYVFDAAVALLNGEDPAAAIDLEKYDATTMGRQHMPARWFMARFGTEYDPLNIDKWCQHFLDKRHLTSMPNGDNLDPMVGLSTGETIQRLVETVEIEAIHIYSLRQEAKAMAQMVAALSARIETLEAKAA